MRGRATWAAALAACAAGIWAGAASAAEIYVSNRTAGNVTAIDTETGSTSTIPLPLGSEPEDIAITPDGSRAYVTSEGNVFVIDTETNTVAAGPIPVGFPLIGVAISPDGSRAYVVRQDDPGELFAIDTTTNAVVGPAIPLGRQSARIAITPDGTRAFVTNTVGAVGQPDLMTVDLLNGTAAPTSITEVNSPRGISIKPDGSQVYVVSNSAGEVAVIDAATSSLAGAPMDGADGFMAISPDGTTGIGTFNQQVQAFDLVSNQPTGPPAEIGDDVDQVAFEPGGSRAWLPVEGVGGDPNRLIALDAQTLAPAGGPFPLGESPRGIAIVPNQPPEPVIDARMKGRKLRVDAGGSSDESLDTNTISWDFGDGAVASSREAAHTYRKPARRTVTLTLDDGQGCPGFVFTGQTASCNGPSVVSTEAVVAPIKLGKLKRNPAKGTAKLKVKATGPGKLKLAGNGVRKDSANVKAGKGGAKLVVRAKGGKRRALERSGAAKLKLKVAYRPNGGEPNTVKKKAKLLLR